MIMVKVAHRIWLVVGGVFILTLAYSLYHQIKPMVDARAYDTIAINLTEGFGFREDRTADYKFDYSIARAGPAYEFFLAGIYQLFGHHYTAVWIIQAFLHALSAWLLWRSAKLIWGEEGENIGLIAAIIFGFHPDLIEISAMLLTETLYLFFVVLTIWAFLKAYYARESSVWGALLGGITGLAILTRPPLILFVPVFLFFYVYHKQFKPLAFFLLALIIVLTPWTVRNYLIYHEVILTTLIGSYNIWFGNTLSSTGGQMTAGGGQIEAYTAINGFFGFKQKTMQEFIGFVMRYPFVFIKLSVIRFIRYFSLIRPMGFWFYQTGVQQMIFIASSLVGIAGLFLAGFSGIAHALRERRTLFYYLVILTLTSPLVLIPTVVQSRYRFQIYPFLALFAGYVIVQFMHNRRVWKEKVVWIPVVALVAVSLIDVGLSFGKIIERIGVWL